jgi:hypothetical protein
VERYLAAGSPERGGFHFDVGELTDVHRELESAGFVQRVFGIAGGVGWRLTEVGLEQTKQRA